MISRGSNDATRSCLSVSGPYYPLCGSSSQAVPGQWEDGCQPPDGGFSSTCQDIPRRDSASLLTNLWAKVLGFNVIGPSWSHVAISTQSLWLGKFCILIGQAWVICPALQLGMGWAPPELQGLSVGEGWLSRGNWRVLSPAGDSMREAGRNNR